MDLNLVPGIVALVERTVLSVFNELNLSSARWVERSRLLTVGRRRYAEFVAAYFATFPLFGAGRTASVDSTYVRVTLTGNIEREVYKTKADLADLLRRQRGGEVRGQDDPTFPVPFSALDDSSDHFALLGAAGSGKTTVFKHLTLQLAKGTPLRGKKRLPIYLAVRDLAGRQQSIQGAAEQLLIDLGVSVKKGLLAGLLKSGRLVLLVDGLDETEPNHQRDLLYEIETIGRRYGSVIICLSGRPNSLSVALPATFTRWEILPLSMKARTDFVRKWFDAVEPRKGDRLLRECGNRPEVLDLGSNPLLLSIVCALYHNDLHLPSEPEELYERALDGLLGRWDAFRNIARTTIMGRVSISRRVLLVSWLAAGLFEHGMTVFSVRDVEDNGVLARGLKAIRVESLPIDELLGSLYNDFGILIERSPGLFSFSHLTFQEYLTARYIRDYRREDELLVQHRLQPEWFEVTRLVARLLPKADRFMSDLTMVTDFRDAHQVRLLRAAWETLPVCSAGCYQKLLERITQTAASILATREHRIERDESCLWILLRDLQSWPYRETFGDIMAIVAGARDLKATPRRRSAILRNLMENVTGEAIAEIRFTELGVPDATASIKSHALPSPRERAEAEFRRLLGDDA